MRKRDYYSILGVSRTASTCRIRSAYRSLAKRFHPDVACSDTTQFFQEIVEAYSVLSDPTSRQEYNDRLRREESTGSFHTGASSGGRHAAARTGFARNRGRVSSTSGLSAPLFRSIFEGIIAPRMSAGSDRSVIYLEIILSWEEAENGGYLLIPHTEACPSCMGAGHTGLVSCIRCLGRGRITTDASIRVHIPPGSQDGTLLEVTAPCPHSGPRLFRMFIRVL